MQSEYDLAVLITGSAIKYGYVINLGFFSKNVRNIIAVGNGTIDIDTILYSELYNIRYDYSQIQNNKILFIIEMHGYVGEGSHLVQYSMDGKFFQTSGLFSFLNDIVNKPIDIILMSCYGKAALQDINNLANGSRVLIFSEDNKITYSNNYFYALEAMQNMSRLSLDSFYDNYLYYLTTKENPVIATVGGKIIDPLLAANNYIGRPIDSETRLYIREHFGHHVCNADEQCYKKLENLMDRMETASSVDEFYQNSDYITEAFKQDILELMQKYELLKNEEDGFCIPYFQRIINMEKKQPECSIHSIMFEADFNLLLAKHNIPGRYNIESNLFDNDDDDDDDDDDSTVVDFLNEYQNLSSRALYDMVSLIKSDPVIDRAFSLDEEFTIPEYPEYGSVLGIAKDIDAFNHQNS